MSPISGSGIAEDDFVHIFEKFNRGGRTGETGGIGLGLSICKGLIEAHHGTHTGGTTAPVRDSSYVHLANTTGEMRTPETDKRVFGSSWWTTNTEFANSFEPVW